MKDEERKDKDSPPKTVQGLPLESPYYEEQFDPYFVEQIEPSVDTDDRSEPSNEDDWYWREPDNQWLEDGIWPWPEARQRRREDETPPEEVEPD
jgi:hypothetical protein